MRARPYWYVDGKWVSGQLLFVAIGTALLVFNLVVLTRRDTAVDVSATILASQFSRDGLDDEAGVADFRQQALALPDGATVPIEQLPFIKIPKEDALTLSSRELRLTAFRQITGPVYDYGVAGAAAKLTNDPVERERFTQDAAILGLATKATHAKLQKTFLAAALSIIPLTVAFVFFSAGWGRIGNLGLMLMLTSSAGVIAGLLLKHPQDGGPLSAISLAPDIWQRVGGVILDSNLTVLLAGIVLIVFAVIGKLVWGRHHKADSSAASNIPAAAPGQAKDADGNDMKIDFVYMAAHELRTPLAAVRGYLELLRDHIDSGKPQDRQKYVNQALRGTAELGGLINNLLNVTRIEKGTLVLHMDRMDLGEIVAHVVNEARFMSDDKHIALNFDLPEDPCEVVGDEMAMREVIINLVTNAIKFTKQGGSVDISLDREGDEYVVRVEDSGIGIPKDAIPRLFAKFYRIHGGLDSPEPGTGLGLYIAKTILERHNGTIGVQSEEGKGSAFTFKLPVLTEERLAAARSDQPQNDSERRRHG